MIEQNSDFKIVVAYDTFASAIQARQLAGRLATELQLDGELDCDFWKFELLEHPQLRDQAAAEAASANMVVICTGDIAELPGPVMAWIEQWPPSREGFAALVALFDLHGEPADTLPVGDFLRRLASERGMDYFCKAGNWWQFDLELLKQIRQPSHIFTTIDAPTHRHQLGAGWGIND